LEQCLAIPADLQHDTLLIVSFGLTSAA